MALEEYRDDMKTCCRCSACKFVPLETLKSYDHVEICPSITHFGFRAYSGGGKLGVGVALLEEQLDYSSPKLREVIYNCQMCGGCDVSCKYAMDMEVLGPLTEIRTSLVEHGNTLPVMDKMAANLNKGGSMVLGAKVGRGEWAKDLGLKDYTREKSEVIYHAGCRTSCDQSLWPVAQSAARMMQKAGIDVGVDFNESCCGGRAYQMGYQKEALRQAQTNMERFKKAGVKTLITGCAECYFSFKVLYDKFGIKDDLRILHTSEFFNQLVKDNRLKPNKAINQTITYHDPCHLGRQGEPYIHWNGKRVPGQLIIFDPPKEFRRGSKGVYDAPRDLLQSIPGLKLVEMARHKEFAWCCGAGGGVRETNPEYAKWTANERVKEAKETGAVALVTGCPGCESLLGETLSENGRGMRVYDIVEILAQSVL